MRHDRSLGEAWQAVAPSPAPPRAGSRWWLGLAGLWLAACVWLLASRAGQIATLTLPDSDDDLRLLQVRDWLGGQGWFDLRQYRLDPPLGADIHWSRLVDLPLAAIVRLATPLFGVRAAETLAATTVPLLTLLAAMALLAGIARRTIAPAAWWCAPLLLLMASPALDMMAPLRIDHHGWQIVAVLGLVLGLITPDRKRGGLVAGIAIAASLAIGVEMLPYLALGAVMAAAIWLADPREGERLRWLCGTAAAATLAALFAFVPPAQRFGLACDALSATYALPLLTGGTVLAGGTIWGGGARTRLGWIGAAGVAAGLPLLLAGGGVCLIDPYHAVDPTARRLWLDRVSEALPLFRQTAEVALASLALPVIGLGGAGLMLRRAAPDERRAWIVLAGFGALSIVLALVSTRAAVAAQALAVPGAAALGYIGRRRLAASGNLLVRVFGSVALFLAVSAIVPRLAIAALFGEAEPRSEAAASEAVAACMSPRALATLDSVPAGIALGLIDTTPALLLHTHHRGLAGPYHRNGAAIADTMRAWGGTPAEAEAIVRRRGIDYLIACGDPAEARLYDKRAPDGFHARLMRGRVPDWLQAVPIANSPWRVWRVQRLWSDKTSAKARNSARITARGQREALPPGTMRL